MLSPVWTNGLEQAWEDAWAAHIEAVDAEDGPATIATANAIHKARAALDAAERDAEFDRR